MLRDHFKTHFVHKNELVLSKKAFENDYTESEIGEDVVDAIYDGDDISIGFNISYLQDVIDVIDGDTLDICINDQNSGCILLDENTNESIFVIMPMRV